MNRIKFSLFNIFIISLLLFSCTSMDKITYINNSTLGEWDKSPMPPKHHIEIGDNLMIRIIVRNDEVNEMFNMENNSNSNNPTTTAANLYLNGYTVNQDGSILLPNVGEVYVLNKNLEEAKKEITKKAREVLIDPVVIVKLANFEFSILGEVSNPGRYPVYKDNITIFEALAMAGDISDYGNLKKVKLIRSYKNQKQIYEIDLTCKLTLSSDYYYLRNEDLIYVQPLKYKSFRKSQSQVVLSTLTTVAVLLNVYLNFNND